MEKSDARGLLIFVSYVALFMGALVFVVWWDARKRRTRKPFAEDVRLLRMPGEYLWRRVIEKDVTETEWTLGLMLVPVIVGCFALQIAARFFNKSSSYSGLVFVIVVFAFVMLLCVAWLAKRVKRRANEYLGFFGERVVGDCLEPLKADGWFIFHDIQCNGASGKFNLDHVAVGPGGIWVVETRTCRKGRERRGQKNYEVIFIGSKLVCPWGDEIDAITEAEDNADWLGDLLQERLGKRFDVFAVMAFPGYYVTERKMEPVRVANPKMLPQVLTGRGNSVLKPEDIDLVRRQLEQLCRDVEY